MKRYPSIPQSTGQSFQGLGLVHVFDKLDGQNLRFEWTPKRGWYKAGSRTQMIDETSEQFGTAVKFFHANVADSIPSCFKRKPQKLVVFGEWWGKNSFAGMHDPDDEMHFSLFDVCVDNRGWMSPTEFRKTFEGQVETARYLGTHNWTRGFVQRVFNHEFDGPTFEGVVAKDLRGPNLIMAKAKTKAWLDKVYAFYPQDVAERLAVS